MSGQPLPGFEIPEAFQPALDLERIETYVVPVDPASLNDCEACQ